MSFRHIDGAPRELRKEDFADASARVTPVGALAFDPRTLPWLSSVLREQVLRVRVIESVSDGVEISVEEATGSLSVHVCSIAWPAAVLIAMACQPWPHLLAQTLEGAGLGSLARLLRLAPSGSVTRIRRHKAEHCEQGLLIELQGGSLVIRGEGLGAMLGGSAHQDKLVRVGARNWMALRLAGRIVLFTKRLAVDVIETLRVGDLVVGANGRGPNGLCVEKIVFGWKETMEANVRWSSETMDERTGAKEEVEPGAIREERGAVVLTQPLGRTTQAFTEPEDAPLTEISELSLPVSFEIDSVRLSMADLSALGAGSVVAVGQPISAALVRMTCQGQMIGRGRLVAVGDRLAVQIEAIAGSMYTGSERSP